jgi:predicted DNA-binding transcriptional regulator AlpA
MSKKKINSFQAVALNEPGKSLPSSQGSKPPYVWLTPKQMVRQYGRSKTYWYLLRKDGFGPAFRPLGARSLAYRQDIVDDWFSQGLVQSLYDPKYIEMAAKRKDARKAAIQKRTPKATPPKFVPMGTSWQEARLLKLRMSQADVERFLPGRPID